MPFSNQTLLVVFSVLALLAIVSKVIRGPRRRSLFNRPQRRARSATVSFSSYSSKALLNGWERKVLVALRDQIPAGLYICPQVRLADFLNIQGEDWQSRQYAVSQVAQKSIDFAIIDMTSGNPVLAIELDGPTHERPDRQRRDALVEGVMRQVNVPLKRFKSAEKVDVRPFFQLYEQVTRQNARR